MKDSESMSHLYSRFIKLFNGLHAIKKWIENHDLKRYSLKAFPQDLSNFKLDKTFCEFELYQQINLDLQEKGIAWVTSKTKAIKPKIQVQS